MKAEELKTKTKDELTKLVQDLRKEQMNLRFQKSGGQLANTARMNVVRKDIARAKTFLTQLENGAVPAPKAAKATKAKAPAKAPAKKKTTA